MSMFCYQCQEAAKGTGCNVSGVCGKNEDVSNLQDMLIYLLKGISVFSVKAREKGIEDFEVDSFIVESLFMTITNANFNREAILENIRKAFVIRESVREKLKEEDVQGISPLHDACTWNPSDSETFEIKANDVGIMSSENEDVRSLRELLIYGVKGIAAYLHHAAMLDNNSKGINAFIAKALSSTLNDNLTVDELVALVLECGKFGVDVMALLDKANTGAYGHPEITKVKTGVGNKPGILISGHDLKDLEELLEQTKGTGVDVYTHSEMLPAHYYPKFKKYDNLVGNYGNAWHKQNEEFEKFNGPILMTTNCITPPKDSYKDRVYTTGVAGFSGVKHVSDRVNGRPKDFSLIIEHARKCGSPTSLEDGEIIGGFAHNQVLSLADKVVEAVKSGAIKQFVVMAGCDGRMKSREYYTDFASSLPNDSVILTAGCAKYRYNKLELGDIGGIPRVLDAGQCNDSYSLAVVALKLKEVFGLDDINKLPIIYNIAWYEQKAVIVLLALLYLGVKNIHLGPTLPAFLSPNVASVLIEKFGISGIIEIEKNTYS